MLITKYYFNVFRKFKMHSTSNIYFFGMRNNRNRQVVINSPVTNISLRLSLISTCKVAISVVGTLA